LLNKIIELLEHRVIDRLISIYRKIKPSKTYWTIVLPVILFILSQAKSWHIAKFIANFSEKQVENDIHPVFWSIMHSLSLEFYDDTNWYLVILGILILIILTYAFVKENNSKPFVKDNISAFLLQKLSEKENTINRLKNTNKSLAKEHKKQINLLQKEIRDIKNIHSILKNNKLEENVLNEINKQLHTKSIGEVLFFLNNLERPWSLSSSEDGTTVLIGYGDDEGKLLQFDLETKKVSPYWTEGSYTFSMDFIDKSRAAVGTNNGTILLIDLINNVRLKSKNISNSTIKDIKYLKNKEILYAITVDEIFVLDILTLDIKDSQNLHFNPWDILLIPNTNMFTVQGTSVTLELYEYTDDGLTKLDSKSLASKNRDMTSIDYNKNHQWIVSASETGFIYIWEVSNKKLKQIHEVDLDGNMIYWLQTKGEYIAFASSRNGVGYIDLKANKLIYIPESQNEGKIKLQEINNNIYLLYTKENKDLAIANLSTNELDIHSIAHRADYIDLTINGDILGITQEGIILDNFIQDTIPTIHNYDFNSKEKNMLVSEFIFNKTEESIILQLKDQSLSKISFDTNMVQPIDFYTKTNIELQDFYGDKILTSDYQNIDVLDIKNKTTININLESQFTTSIDRYSLLSETQTLLINTPDYASTPSIAAKINVLNSHGNIEYTKELETALHFVSVYDSKVVSADIMDESTIFDINTQATDSFDTGFAFGEDGDTFLFSDCKYCMALSITTDSDVSYELKYYDLFNFDANNRSKMIWRVEDPILSDFSLLGFCQLDNNFYIINKQSGELISISIDNGDMVNTYKLQENIIDIKISDSGKYIAWKLKTGEFSYISYPFQSCEVLDA